MTETSASSEPNPTVSGLWRPRTIKNILENEIYLGRLIQGKTKAINFVRRSTPADEWIICDEAHEAIVSVELSEAVQALRSESRSVSKNSSKTPYATNIFKGKVYCAHCGSYLERKKSHDRYIYTCAAYRLVPDSCAGNRSGENDIRFAVFEQLRQHKDRISDSINTPSAETDIISELRFLEMELSHTQDIIRSLYENLVNRVLSESEYRELKSSYQGKVEPHKQRVDELKQKLNDNKREKATLREDLRILNELAETKELTKEHIDRFVERVEVFRDGQVFVVVRIVQDT